MKRNFGINIFKTFNLIQVQQSNQVQQQKNMSKDFKACLNIQKHLSDGQFQAFAKKIPNFKTEKEIFNELSKIIKEKQFANNFAKQLYQQLEESRKSKIKDSKIIMQLKKAIQDQKQFQDFKKKIIDLNLEELKTQLYLHLGKKKADIIAEQLYQQILKSKQENCKSLLEIKGILQQKQFQEFQQKLKKFTTVDQILDDLSNYMGRKKAKPFAESLHKELGMNQSKKDRLLTQIEKQINDEEDYGLFLGKLPKITQLQDMIKELSLYLKKNKAQSLGSDLFNQINKGQYNSPKPVQVVKKKEPVIKEVVPEKPPKKAINQVEELINDKKGFAKFEKKLLNAIFIEELVEQLTEYLNRKQATKLAEQIFKELGKDKIVYKKIEKMYRDLAQKGINELAIQNIRNLVDQGKKNAARRNINNLLGSTGGQKIFDQYSSEIEQRLSQPFPGSKFINIKNGLKIYQYKEPILESQKSGAKTIIVFGETGCGKTTFLNSIVNYIAAVQMEDEFRYKIIIENEDNQKKSITSKITSYYIKSSRGNKVYRLVDTPGFGDTEGVQKDNKIVDMVKKAFKSEIQSVHNILFLLKSSTTRVTHYQRYVFQNIMDLFNKNIAPNFVFIFTFSDSGKPQVLESVQDKTYGFGNYWHLIQDPKYLQVNNCGIFEKIDLSDKIKTGYWQIGMLCMEKLFNKIHNIKPQSLTLSRQLLDARQALTNKMKLARQKIENAIAKRQNLINELQKTIQFQQQIDNNKDFYYYVEVQQYYTENTADNVTRCINCTDCNCHQSCSYGDGDDKRQCVAFDPYGNCMLCPGKCHFTCHRNQHYLRKVRNVQQKKQNFINKSIYQQSSNKLKVSQSIINSLMEEIDIVVKTTIESTKQMMAIQQQLLAQQMSTKRPQTTVQYLQHLISNQNRDKKPGYLNRVKGMNQIINEYIFYEDMLIKNGKIQEKVAKKFQYEAMMERIKKTNNQGFINKFFSFFKKWIS